MGGVCSANQRQKQTIQCPHKNVSKKGTKPTAIGQDFGQKQICQLCLRMREMKEFNQSANLMELKSQLSLTTQNQDDTSGPKLKRRISKLQRKSINDFQVVRGLGKGAFGRVYLIKERENWQPLAVGQDIMSIKLDEMADEAIQEIEQPQNLQISFREIMEGDKDSASQRSGHKSSKNASTSDKQRKNRESNMSSLKKLPTRIEGTRYYALKIINKNLIKTKKDVQQAMSERYILQAMDHPFIVKLYYAFQTKSRLFLIVDLLAGGQLFYLLRKTKRFDQKTAKFYAAEILLAIEYLHKRSIIYRDVKPQNILLDDEGHLKITDFGLSKILYSSNEKTYSLCGTPEYMAPEVIMGQGYNQSADWFSFGSLIYDMLTGRPPFLNNNKNAMLKNIITKAVPLPYYISQQAKSLLGGLFKRKPEQRLGFNDGASEIKNHPFFQDIDFDKLQRRQIQPPVNFKDSMKNYQKDRQKDKVMLNSAGFEQWNSWHRNFNDSPQGRKMNETRPRFQGFTFQQQQQYQFAQQEQQQQSLPQLQ